MKAVITLIVGALVGCALYAVVPMCARGLTAYVARTDRRCMPLFDAAGVTISRRRLYALYAAGPVIALAIAARWVRPWWFAVMAAAFMIVVTADFPYRVARHLHARRITKIKGQLVDALGMISNALRSGLSLQQGFQMASEEMPPPIAEELHLIMSSQQLGRTFDAALHEFKERVPIEEVELMVSSLTVLRETGGNIIETLEVITHTIREEQRVQSKIKTATTQGVAQAVVISALPFFLAAALYMIAPQYIMPLFVHPLGWALIGVMLLMQGLGVWMMKKIVTIKV